MGIRILSPEEIEKGVANQTPALLFPNSKKIYAYRAERLEHLAKKSQLADYLNFLSMLATTQQKVFDTLPLKTRIKLNDEELAYKPLNCQTWKRGRHWINILRAILAEIKVENNPLLQETIDWLNKALHRELNALADLLLNEEFEKVESSKALFIWSALMVYWQQLVQKIPHTGIVESGHDLNRCPICNAFPSASLVHMGDRQGLRYLHCSLCETEWNMVRAKCTNCDQAKELAYFMERDQAPIRTETCDQCKSYLKIFYLEKDLDLEVLADDVASLMLDIQMNEKGYACSGLKPYLFSNE